MADRTYTLTSRPYSEVTDRIVAALERGVAPWVCPWGARQAPECGLLPGTNRRLNVVIPIHGSPAIAPSLVNKEQGGHLIPPSASAPVHQQRRALQPEQIAAILDGLATVVRSDGNADVLVSFAIDRLARHMGATATISTSTDPVDVVLDLGAALQNAVCRALDDPSSRDHTPSAVSVIFGQIMGELRRRRLAT